MTGVSSMPRTRMMTAATNWPVDPFRPHVQVRVLLESLADHPRLTPEAVKAMEGLRSNTIKKKYPLPAKILKPASMPLHYTRLVEAFEKSAQGIARPWWKIFFNVW
ncbi:uncharacterized protein BXZ73DRAFT_91601 [Epithele typhae]|uniref:uncharacterized protein n=1 Tax=Epithele typhae TaxID=378194 RepID=UPI002008962F|nr:uncharacterized protein BXZ73DRAFT_91601 [Epithele typhae]KAH9922308.1 hypothetical protein BXZ73DRAFT_91601 [Epithele typhae]